MEVSTPQDLARALKAGTRLFGIDVGEKRIGVAVSDVALRVASPVETLVRKRSFWPVAETLVEMAEERLIGGVVYGLPVNMDGSEGPSCRRARQFAENMAARWSLPFLMWDERMSTMAVERQMLEADMSRAKRAAVRDAAAAAYILQGALDALD